MHPNYWVVRCCGWHWGRVGEAGLGLRRGLGCGRKVMIGWASSWHPELQKHNWQGFSSDRTTWVFCSVSTYRLCHSFWGCNFLSVAVDIPRPKGLREPSSSDNALKTAQKHTYAEAFASVVLTGGSLLAVPSTNWHWGPAPFSVAFMPMYLRFALM